MKKELNALGEKVDELAKKAGLPIRALFVANGIRPNTAYTCVYGDLSETSFRKIGEICTKLGIDMNALWGSLFPGDSCHKTRPSSMKTSNEASNYILDAIVNSKYKSVTGLAIALGMDPHRVLDFVSGRFTMPFGKTYTILTSVGLDPMDFYKKFVEDPKAKEEFKRKNRSSQSHIVPRTPYKWGKSYKYIRNVLYCENIPFNLYCNLAGCTNRSLDYYSSMTIDRWPFKAVMAFCDICYDDPKKLFDKFSDEKIRKICTPYNEPDNIE